MFRGGFTAAELSAGRGSDTEWLGITAWAVAQVTAADVAEVQRRVLGIVPTPVDPLDVDPEGRWDALWR
jgi:hypothetical protein